jgi:hypothetical protein
MRTRSPTPVVVAAVLENPLFEVADVPFPAVAPAPVDVVPFDDPAPVPGCAPGAATAVPPPAVETFGAIAGRVVSNVGVLSTVIGSACRTPTASLGPSSE